MIKLIGAIFRYSLLVFVVLILSHVVEIKGRTVSDRVKGMVQWVIGMDPSDKIEGMQRKVAQAVKTRNESLHAVDQELSPTDEKNLRKILKSVEAQIKE